MRACKLYVPRREKESDIKATFERRKSEVKTKLNGSLTEA